MNPHPIVLFDGQCGLCARSVQFIARRDRRCVFRFAPLQGVTAAQECSRLGIARPDGGPDTMILIDGERALTRSAAALAIASQLALPWRLLAIMRIIPRPLRDAAYRWIARNRHRWLMGRESCALGSPELRRRILD
jgi:predicted DCC family thiol-disulfide oxidoreductase YuxK